MTRPPDFRAMAAILAQNMPELTFSLLGRPTQRRSDEWRYGRKGSLAVCVAGAKCGEWFDHQAGRGGDALSLVAHVQGGSLAEALHWARDWLRETGTAPARRPPRAHFVHKAQPAAASPAAPEVPTSWSARMAAALWAEGVDPRGTLVATYLATRGLQVPQGAPLRFHPCVWRARRNGTKGPAMLARMSCPLTGAELGTHVTYVRIDGTGKAPGPSEKIMLGKAGVIRLVADEDVTQALGIAEGIETALSIMQGAGWSPVWAATSASAIGRFPLLPGVNALTILADSDDVGMQHARACANRWINGGRQARIFRPARPGQDFNDTWQALLAAEEEP